MAAHARTWYPSECCGLLIADQQQQQVKRVVCLDNLQDRYHERCPEDFPRSSRDAFKVDERLYARIAEECAAQGERIIAVFHSHIDCGAYFSQEDRLMAAPFGTPNDPDLWHVVIDHQAQGVVGAQAFHWDGKDFAAHNLPHFTIE